MNLPWVSAVFMNALSVNHLETRAFFGTVISVRKNKEVAVRQQRQSGTIDGKTACEPAPALQLL